MPTKSSRTGGRTRSLSGGRMTVMNWLFKEEPTHYSYDNFVSDKCAVWSGVRNPVAQRHLHAVKKGDRVFYYHTGDEKAIVGIAKAAGNAYPYPEDASDKSAVFELVQVKKLNRPVKLKFIKSDRSYA